MIISSIYSARWAQEILVYQQTFLPGVTDSDIKPKSPTQGGVDFVFKTNVLTVKPMARLLFIHPQKQNYFAPLIIISNMQCSIVPLYIVIDNSNLCWYFTIRKEKVIIKFV